MIQRVLYVKMVKIDKLGYKISITYNMQPLKYTILQKDNNYAL